MVGYAPIDNRFLSQLGGTLTMMSILIKIAPAFKAFTSISIWPPRTGYAEPVARKVSTLPYRYYLG